MVEMDLKLRRGSAEDLKSLVGIFDACDNGGGKFVHS